LSSGGRLAGLAGGTGSTVSGFDDGGEPAALDVTGVDAGGEVAGGGADEVASADDVGAGCELEEAAAGGGAGGGDDGEDGGDDDPTAKLMPGSRPPEAEIVSE
jgi:hypothetical protein